MSVRDKLSKIDLTDPVKIVQIPTKVAVAKLIPVELKKVCEKLGEQNAFDDYDDWTRIGLALAQYGEDGREFYHIASRGYENYSVEECDKKFDNALKTGRGEISEKTIYWYARKYGIESPKQTRTEILRGWLEANYSVYRNEIDQKIFVDDAPLTDGLEAAMYEDAEKALGSVSRSDLQTVLQSDKNISRHPVREYFESLDILKGDQGIIKKFLSTIQGNQKDGFIKHFGKKWLVSIVASAFGEHSPLMLVLAGEKQNTGKTQFFRRLFPTPLMPYYAESKFDIDKDAQILLTQKLLILDDELSGKSKREEGQLKSLLSSQEITVRAPYDRYPKTLKRMAVLCGTTNNMDILSDPTGNRRIIPVHVESMDFETANDIDRGLLFTEAYALYKSGFDWRLNQKDIELLAKYTRGFERLEMLDELILQYLRPGSVDDGAAFKTATQIIQYIVSRCHIYEIIKTNPARLGRMLTKYGFVRISRRQNGVPIYGYYVCEVAKENTEIGE